MIRSHVGLGSLILISVLAGPVPKPAPPASELPCEAAYEWVLENRRELPTTLDELALLPMAFRKAVYAEFAPELKQSLWREHLTSFLGEGSLLTATQQAIVRLVLTNLDRYIVDDRARGRAALEADGWTQERLAAEFGDLATAMFSTLGPADDADDDLQMPYCSCSTESDYCSGECNSSNVECKVTGGCGTLWCHECDGLCYDPDPV